MKDKKFLQIQTVINILDAYQIQDTDIVPVPQSFPNGTADFSTQAYITFGVNWDGGFISEANKKELIELGCRIEEGMGLDYVIIDNFLK